MLPLLPLILTRTLLIEPAPASTQSTAATDRSRIVIDQKPPTVSRLSFDPATPPPDMPALSGKEAALTRFDFECGIHVSYNFSEAPTIDDRKRVHVLARLQRVEAKLTLEDRIYLPLNANVPLRSHEEGHWVIDQRVYSTAEAAARVAAEDAMTRLWPGEGASEDEAGKAATDAAVKAIGKAYLAATADHAGRVSDAYDRITQHGTRPINVARAVEEAFDEDAESGGAR